MPRRRDWDILTTQDRVRWGQLADGLQRRDVFFRAEYAMLFERSPKEKAQLFVFGDETSYVVYPFFMRSIDDLPFLHTWPINHDTGIYYDIISPYGYSGPNARIDDPSEARDLWQGFLDAFHSYCLEAHVICEFARLNPFAENERHLQVLTGGVRRSNEITYLDLTQSEEDLWQGLNRGNRSNINKAKRHGVTVRRCADKAHVQRFYELYVDTMDRNEASPWYYFSPRLFADTLDLLGEKASLFCAEYEGETVAAASLLHDGDVAHYFLGASDRSSFALRPNNLLMYTAICWAKRQGYRLFNLGGGYQPGDSLSRFKAAFSKLTTSFYTYRMVHQPDIYNALCNAHSLYAQGAEISSDYFPRYRATVVQPRAVEPVGAAT